MKLSKDFLFLDFSFMMFLNDRQINLGAPMAFIKMLNTFQSDIKRNYSSIFLSF